MFGMPGVRGFPITAHQSLGRVSCNARGIFVGSIPLLEQVNGLEAAAHDRPQR
jgi:hypothetical protein